MSFAILAAGQLMQFTLAPLFTDHGIPLALMGVVVVFLALSMVVAFIAILPRVLARFTSDVSQTSIQPPQVDDQLSDEIRVVIAAAVSLAMDQPSRIVRIRGLRPEDLGWSLEGRMHQHRSHRVQQRGRGPS